MEGLAEIHANSMERVNSASTLSLRKLFGSRTLHKKGKYGNLDSRSASVNSCHTLASGHTEVSRSSKASAVSGSSQKSSSSTGSSTSTSSTGSKASKYSYDVDRFSGPKNVPKKTDKEYYNSRSYHDACWAQAYAFGGR